MPTSIKFFIDNPVCIFRETNSLVEEFMLLANISVAKKIYEHFPQHAVLRKHQKPPVSNFDILIKAAEGQVRLQIVALLRWNPM